MSDLELLIALLGDGPELESAVSELRRQYYSRVRRFLARLLPFCDDSEISREAENVLAQFAAAVQGGAVQDETAICSTLIKKCRAVATDVMSRFSTTQIPIQNSPTAPQCASIRDAVATGSDEEKVVVRQLLRQPSASNREVFIAARAAMPTITLLDVVEARDKLVQRVKEVIDGTKDDAGRR